MTRVFENVKTQKVPQFAKCFPYQIKMKMRHYYTMEHCEFEHYESNPTYGFRFGVYKMKETS